MITLKDLIDFKFKNSEIPNIKIKSLYFENFMVFDKYNFDFTDNGRCKNFICFIGPNGTGKSTILNTIQIIFSRYDDYEKNRLKNLLGKSVRHIDGKSNGMYDNSDFLIKSEIETSIGNYEIELTKNGFVKDHPDEIKYILYRLCFNTRFDQELHQFQLPKEKWNIFKDLFESVTGFEIIKNENYLNDVDDHAIKEIYDNYVLGFKINKNGEIINREDCSAGEKKIIKSFSTLLTKEYDPKIILIDNIEMHVESGRHIKLIECMKKSFPNSQIFSTTHSYHVSRNFLNKKELYDLRIIKANDIIKNNKWRLNLIDEINDNIFKLKSISKKNNEINKNIKNGLDIIEMCKNETDNIKVLEQAKKYVMFVSEKYIESLI